MPHKFQIMSGPPPPPNSLLFFAVVYENEPAVKCLLDRGADVRWRNSTGTNVLRLAAKRGLIGIGDRIVEAVGGHPGRIKEFVNTGWS